MSNNKEIEELGFEDVEGFEDLFDIEGVEDVVSDLKEHLNKQPEVPEVPEAEPLIETPKIPKKIGRPKGAKNKAKKPKKGKKGKVVLEDKVVGPQAGPQTDFLATKADIAIYGGGAGGGKTVAEILETMRHLNDGNFGAVIFRRTSTQIRSQGGLLDETKSFYPLMGGVLKDSKLKWIFPSGAQVDLRYLEYDKDVLNYMGSQICLLCFDELTHFSKSTFFYMLSRNRSVCDVKPYVRATCNPDSSSWVAEFIDWWIGEDGYPIVERAGKLRYFRRYEDIMHWADSKDELMDDDLGFKAELAELDTNDKFYMSRVLDLKERYYNDYKSVTFIPSLVTDNKILMEKNPSYLANLKALPLVEKEQLLYGNWSIKSEAGKFFNRDWFKKIKNMPLLGSGSKVVRYWDFASTKPNKANRDPDYTVGVRMRKDEGDNTFYIDDVIAVRDNPGEVERIFLGACMKDRAEIEAEGSGAGYMVRWEEEGGASGKKESWRLKNLLIGYDANGVRSNRNKETRARALAVQCESGNVVIKEAPWNDKFLTTMHLFTDDDSKHDDIVDGSSGAFNSLTSDYIFPVTFGINDKEVELTDQEYERKMQENMQKIEDDFLNCSDMD